MSSQGPGQGGETKFSQSVAGDLVRPRYSPGLILEDSDLTAAVDYSRDLSRLLFRSLFGCGVVCGLIVSVKTDPELVVTVAPGLALDGCGDPVHLVSTVTFRLGRLDGVLPQGSGSAAAPKHADLWVVLGAAEKRCAPRELVSDADEIDVHTQPTRIRAGAEVSILFERPKCLCRCPPPPAGQDPKKPVDCHKEHADRIDCAPDGGCGAGCDCDCGVLLARLHWQKDGGWRAIHIGERRFLRPLFGPDPVSDQVPGQP